MNRRPLISGLMIVLLLTLTQCVTVCQGSREGAQVPEAAPTSTPPTVAAADQDRPPTRTTPKGLDTQDLDPDEVQLLLEILDEQFDPCGSSESFLKSLEAGATCELSAYMTDFTVKLMQRGLSKRQAVALFLKELARRSSKAEFSLEGVPHHGDPSSDKVLVEFIDYQCPYCAEVSKPAKKLAQQYGAVLYIKQLPLGDHHPLAKPAARMALAAHNQGKFWEVHEAFYANQARLSEELLDELAKKAGVDLKKAKAEIAAGTYDKTIADHAAEADRLRVDGTPFFFLNGYAVEFDELETALSQD